MSKKKKSVAVLVSGGIDSCVLLADLCREADEVFPVYIRCGYRWENAELHWLEKFIEEFDAPVLSPLIILDLPMKDLHTQHWSMRGEKVPAEDSVATEVYLPGRNLLLISKAAVFCVQQKVDTLAMGILKGNPFPDASPKFFSELAHVVDTALDSKLQVETPYLSKTKVEILKKASKWIPLGHTFSCLNPVEYYHCGACNKCSERKQAFADAQIDDPTGYVDSIMI